MNSGPSSEEGLDDRSEFRVAKMDCPSEERTIRLALDGVPEVRALEFDLPGRRLVVRHRPGAAAAVTRRLEALRLGAALVETAPAGRAPSPVAADPTEARTLWMVLAINAVMFVAEVIAGFLVQSAGLLADSLDMLADAMVYGLALVAVRRTVANQVRVARVSGVVELALAVGALSETARRFLFGSEPKPGWMIAVSTVALIANVSCLVLLSRHRQGGAHMRASYIFSTNDVLANVGVILAGVLVAVTGSRYPDLVIGALIGLLVLSGAIRILRIRG